MVAWFRFECGVLIDTIYRPGVSAWSSSSRRDNEVGSCRFSNGREQIANLHSSTRTSQRQIRATDGIFRCWTKHIFPFCIGMENFRSSERTQWDRGSGTKWQCINISVGDERVPMRMVMHFDFDFTIQINCLSTLSFSPGFIISLLCTSIWFLSLSSSARNCHCTFYHQQHRC